MSIARGFTHKIRELFGGPRGCTHTTALLQAMAPVAIQSIWSFNMAQARAEGERSARSAPTRHGRRALMANANTCHVWAEDGEHVAGLRAGGTMDVPLWISKRFDELGRRDLAPGALLTLPVTPAGGPSRFRR